ncbi:HAD-IC family P-type ATPase [Bradyrhizobium canariense]|uniref:H+-transporting ATPase n=1 Tax=Bradyrhizobium canariense TaxID=255045 RepID=A0A1H1SYG0_9BRAD|nr:HAD-IC family P-type ATPase [Bradyrhizobium canariense]SDS52756.1 H+-transporting ATPase [Bradyrhizobium canariense]
MLNARQPAGQKSGRGSAAADSHPASLRGLTNEEARHRTCEFGLNTTADAVQHPLRLILSKFIAPVPCLLEAAIVLQLVLGEYVEAAIIALLLLFNAALGYFQEGRAQATIAALKSRLALNAVARRDGSWTILPAAELVPGDVVKLTLGSVVAADVRIAEGTVLLDQSMLTGESMPIEATSGSDTYAGALVRRGEAIAEVTATGTRTRFGRTAELVRTAYVASSQQKAVLQIVIYLAAINGVLTAGLVAYAFMIHMTAGEIIPLALIAVLASVPVALPATFTLATAIGAQALAKKGVLPTRLSAVDEAGTMNVLCVDKTGTLTRNELAVTAIVPMAGFDEADVVSLARLASSDAGQDPVDAAVRAAAIGNPPEDFPKLTAFIPFDPATKMAEATAIDATGATVRIVKGALAKVAELSQPSVTASTKAAELEARGFRVLGVAVGSGSPLRLAGLIALSDPPRTDTAACIANLHDLGVPVVMVTGDAAATAAVVAQAVGIKGGICPPGSIPAEIRPEDFAVFAGVLPEDKFTLVKAFQKAGYKVGMCGDGANDAPALRQAEIGIAVSTATDVAKSAAGVVLMEPGLAGIQASVIAGRVAFQRILTYTLRSIIHKVRQILFLAAGLVMTDHAILTPMLMVISMITGDFLAMSSTTDNVRPSSRPNSWRIGRLTLAGTLMGIIDLAFCVSVLAIGKYDLRLDIETLRTLTLVTLVFSGQALYYVVRERRHLWSSRPSNIVIVCSIADLLIIPTLAVTGTLMAPLPVSIVLSIFAAAAVFAFVLDAIKLTIFRRFQMD